MCVFTVFGSCTLQQALACEVQEQHMQEQHMHTLNADILVWKLWETPTGHSNKVEVTDQLMCDLRACSGCYSMIQQN